MWLDFDPNWRQFIGTTFELLLQDGLITDASLRGTACVSSIELAVPSEPVDRVPPNYSNIALMRAWLEVEHGGPAPRRTPRRWSSCSTSTVPSRSTTRRPTTASTSMRWRCGATARRRRCCGRRALASRPRCGGTSSAGTTRRCSNLCGPWSRSYGMDMRVYASLLGIWMWPAVGSTDVPFPDVGAPFEHAHDLSHAPMADWLRPVVPDDVDLVTFGGEHTVEQRITSSRRGHGLAVRPGDVRRRVGRPHGVGARAVPSRDRPLAAARRRRGMGPARPLRAGAGAGVARVVVDDVPAVGQARAGGARAVGARR